VFVVDGTFGTIPTVEILRGRSFCSCRNLIAVNSLTAKSVLAGTKLVLFGRYVLNIYVGIV
jgi:hypothetical protein